MRDHRQVVEGVIYRYAGDCLACLAVLVRPMEDGVEAASSLQWRRDLGQGLGRSACSGRKRPSDREWTVNVDSTINRAHQHATNLPRGELRATCGAAEAVVGLLTPARGE